MDFNYLTSFHPSLMSNFGKITHNALQVFYYNTYIHNRFSEGDFIECYL